MKKLVPFLLITICSVVSFAQNAATTTTTQVPAPVVQNEWSKGERAEVYEECKSMLGKYPAIPEESKKSVALEYMKAITSKYSRNEWHALIDVELERIQSSTLATCAKNVGVVLEVPKEETKTEVKDTKLSMQTMKGIWLFEEGKFTFTESGNYVLDFDGKKCNGHWAFSDNVISITPNSGIDKAFGTCKSYKFDIVEYVSSKNEITIMEGKKVYTLRKPTK